jgi:integrase/recombinase XerD
MKLSDAITDYLLTCEVEQKTKMSIAGYRFALGRFEDVIGGDTEIDKLTSSHIRLFMAHEMKRDVGKKTESGLLSTQSLHKYYTVVRTFIRWMYIQRMIPVCLTDYTKAPRMDQGLPTAMTEEEIGNLFAHLEQDGSNRNIVIFELYLDTGLRMEEVCNLNVDDIHIHDGWLRVFGKGRKEGMVPMGVRLCKDLSHYMLRCRRPKDPEEKALFINKMGLRIGREGMSTMVRRTLADIGVIGKHGPHKLRHTFATNFLRNGGNLESLRRILRHTSIKTTQIYTNLLSEDIQSDHRKASPLDNYMRKH